MRISRPEMLMGIAKIVAKRGTCLRRQVGAVIARNGRVLATGYNGAPTGMPHCSPATCTVEHPCTIASHAEANAIAWAAREGISTLHATLYLTLSPCLSCARLIINAGIESVVYLEEYRDPLGVYLLRQADLYCEPAKSSLDELVY